MASQCTFLSLSMVNMEELTLLGNSAKDQVKLWCCNWSVLLLFSREYSSAQPGRTMTALGIPRNCNILFSLVCTLCVYSTIIPTTQHL